MKNHSVSVTITSKSGEVVNQSIVCTEFAGDEAELVHKHTRLAGAVIGALSVEFGTMAGELQSAVDEAGGDFSKVKPKWRKG